MSSGPNHRRGEDRSQDNGPTWEGSPPCSGCNSTHVAKARTKWRKRGRRAERRTGKRGANKVMYFTGQGQQMPDARDWDLLDGLDSLDEPVLK
jgi:hypothetical protein